MVREDTGAPSEGATCAWMVVDETVGCTRAFLEMWRSSRRPVCRGRPKPVARFSIGLRSGDCPGPVLASSFYSQYGLSTISGLPLHDDKGRYRPEKSMTDSQKDISQLVAIHFVVFQCNS
ncbi:uncharacterized protein TNCV_4378411 [Trichonephila clavipes]|nr:uncharacterized protein TNCV_4378411 [Trichonephila clavipes]